MFLDFYHLREQPFGVTPDPAYLYPTATHCEALDGLTEAILGDRGFMALIAEPGMGKTTLLYQVLEKLRDTAQAVFLFQTQCSPMEFFQYLLSEIGVDTNGMGLVAMHNKLNEILFAEMLAGKRFVLIVDEAQNLDDRVLETIRLLSNFETPHSKLLQIVLSGQPELGEKLEQKHLSQLLQRITLVRQLEPLCAKETTGYIRHRLKIAGHCGEGLFEPDALALIAERSHGIPRNINKICFRALLEAYARGELTVSADIVVKAERKLNVLTPAGLIRKPAPKPLPAPLQMEPVATTAEVEVPAEMQTDVSLQLTYQPMTESGGWRRWGIWAGALVAVLLLAGLALAQPRPRSMLKAAMQMMRHEVTATKSFVKREEADYQRNSAVAPAANLEVAEPLPSTGGTPNITAIQLTSTPSDAQVVVLLDDAVRYESARIPSPDRIYFDLYKARLSPAVGQRTVPAEGGLLKGVRAAQNRDEVVRLVLDADGAKDYSAQLLPSPYRLVINIHAKAGGGADGAQMAEIAKRDIFPSLTEAGAVHAGQLSLTRELGLKISRIAIDPGHGGNDTGTKGAHGLLEKNLCLDVALRLGQLIEENIPGAEVVYTRKDDRYISLEDRTAIANNANADLFVSIHANSSAASEARGAETYYLNLAAAKESRELAARENALAESSMHDLPDLIKKIARNERMAESRLLAVDIQNTLSQGLQLVSQNEMNRGVKQAPFVVLAGANMPAVLSEISFVSNANDESLLLGSAQRQRVAEGLYRGIEAYLDGLHSLTRKGQKLVSETRPSIAPGLIRTPGGRNAH